MPIIEKEAKELISGLNTQNSEVLGTIYLPKNLKVLGNKLPKPNYKTPARRAPSPEEIIPEVRTKETRNNVSRQRRFSLGKGIVDDRESRISHPYTKKYGCNPVMKAREELKKVNMDKPILPPRPKYFPLFIIVSIIIMVVVIVVPVKVLLYCQIFKMDKVIIVYAILYTDTKVVKKLLELNSTRKEQIKIKRILLNRHWD